MVSQCAICVVVKCVVLSGVVWLCQTVAVLVLIHINAIIPSVGPPIVVLFREPSACMFELEFKHIINVVKFTTG